MSGLTKYECKLMLLPIYLFVVRCRINKCNACNALHAPTMYFMYLVVCESCVFSSMLLLPRHPVAKWASGDVMKCPTASVVRHVSFDFFL